MSQENNKIHTDWIMFGATALTILLVCLPTVIFNEQSAGVITNLYDLITQKFGVLYIWYATGVFGFLMWLGFSRFGSVRLGEQDSRPEFKTISWVGMLFCAGIGAGLMYWAVIEWGYYIDAPPRGLDPRSAEATEWAATYGLYHWGISAWAFYCLPTLAIAYPYYVRKIPYLRLSTACTHTSYLMASTASAAASSTFYT